jgi:hypothetical protein
MGTEDQTPKADILRFQHKELHTELNQEAMGGATELRSVAAQFAGIKNQLEKSGLTVEQYCELFPEAAFNADELSAFIRLAEEIEALSQSVMERKGVPEHSRNTIYQ